MGNQSACIYSRHRHALFMGLQGEHIILFLQGDVMGLTELIFCALPSSSSIAWRLRLFALSSHDSRHFLFKGLDTTQMVTFWWTLSPSDCQMCKTKVCGLVCLTEQLLHFPELSQCLDSRLSGNRRLYNLTLLLYSTELECLGIIAVCLG